MTTSVLTTPDAGPGTKRSGFKNDISKRTATTPVPLEHIDFIVGFSVVSNTSDPIRMQRVLALIKAASFKIMRDTRSTVAWRDTSQKAGEVYFRRLNGMTPSERLGLGAALWEAGDSLQRAAIRRKDPHADEAEITFRIAVTRFGSELAKKVYRKS